MLLFILSIIFAIIGVVLLLKLVTTDDRPLRLPGIAVLVLAALLFIGSLVHTVDPGQVAVPVTFGSTGEPVGAGVHVMAPWTGLTSVNVRTVQYKADQPIDTKGSDGATGDVDLSVLYHVNESDAGRIYRDVGTDYETKIVHTNARACTRDAFARVPMVAAATTKRGDVEQDIRSCIEDTVQPRGITVEQVTISNILVSEAVQNSINAKVAAQQDSERKVFELESARQEAEKSNIEKKAVSDGQQIIKCGGTVVVQDDDTTLITPNTGAACENQLTPEYLQWAYIDMMRQVSNSPNHDTIIIPAPSAQSQTDILVQPGANP